MYDTSIRGKIYNRKRATQILSFENLVLHRNITPTDIDGFIDFKGNAFVYMDAKLYGIELSIGQRIAYENVVKSHEKGGNKSCAIIFRHNIPVEHEILCYKEYVDEFYWKSENGFAWHSILNKQITLKEFLNKIQNIWKKQGYTL